MFNIITINYRQFFRSLVKQVTKPKFLALVATSILILLLCFFTPLKAVFNPILFKSFIGQYEGYVEIIFIAIYTALTIIGVPGTVLTIVGGCLFGIWYGTVISVISATSGALCAFWTARYLFHQSAQRRFSRSKRLTRFQGAVLEQPFFFVLTTRLIPISPYNLVNYLFGLTSINWADYTLATFIGVIPGSFVYSWIGKSGEIAMAGGDRLSFFLALTFLALLSVIPLVYRPKKT
ncbi:MAG: TVP38/TMEM64 family protein [Cyanobacteria bacterium P01_A01_bin.40]